MQQPGAIRLRLHHAAHPFAIECGQRGVINDHRQMKHPSQRRIAGGDLLHQAGHVSRHADVGFDDLHLHATRRQGVGKRLRIGGGRAAAAGEHEVPRTAIHEPLRDHLAESAKRPGDQVCAVGAGREARRERFAARRQERLGERHDHLADVLASGHEPEGRVDPARRERTEGQRDGAHPLRPARRFPPASGG